MDGRISKNATAATLVAAALEGTLTEAQAKQLAALDPVLQKLAWLAAAQRIAELLNGPRIDPPTPSGQRPVYTKPAASNRKRKPGARQGHEPARRSRPQRIDQHEEHRLDVCPDCGGDLRRCNRKRTRTVEEILDDLKAVVTEHTLHRDYCPACSKHVEPVVPDALPKAAVGHRLVSLTAWLHYGLLWCSGRTASRTAAKRAASRPPAADLLCPGLSYLSLSGSRADWVTRPHTPGLP